MQDDAFHLRARAAKSSLGYLQNLFIMNVE